jgi:integrase
MHSWWSEDGEMPQSVHLAQVPPTNEKFTVRRKPNAEYRSREHLTEREVERLIEAVKGNRHGHRDATMVLVAYRHGLRASELIDLRWEQVDLEHALLHVRRLKTRIPLRYYGVAIGMICGGFAMIGIAQALRLLLVVVALDLHYPP